ncbi:MAG: helix-turn-helix domain-containing protein [Ilumatobacter sp.]|uniref:helix-turn-helix domain-containing protein n=1 Tax=Ilumatobacter sp. TaxID=1967498 RepID=UPI0032977A70
MNDSIDATGQVGVPDLLGVPEAAALLRVGLTFAYESTARFIATGSNDEIPAIKVGRLTRVPRVALERFMGVPITWPIPVVAMPAVRPSESVGSGVSSSRAAGPRRRPRPAPPQSAPRLFES